MAATITATATRITVSGTYKAFASTTGSTSTVINFGSGNAPAVGDAGRFLMWRNDTSLTSTWEIRYIESATSTTVTVGDGGFSSAPGTGESFYISTNLADIKTAVSASVAVNGNQYSFGNRDWSLTSGAFVADVDKSLYMESAAEVKTQADQALVDYDAATAADVSGVDVSADVASIKAKTDNLTFTGTDVHATLSGEEVVTDAASRKASKAKATISLG